MKPTVNPEWSADLQRRFYPNSAEAVCSTDLLGCKFSRVWAMPSHDTFSVKPIGDFVRRYLSQSQISIDPFARNKQWATHTNDLNPATSAQHHMDAEAFLKMLATQGVKADLIIFDPPYSPRQISECYKSIGMEVGMKETQSALLYQRVRDAIAQVCTDDAIVLSFGWNSVGMGKRHGFEQIEIMLCCHGGAHNDTVCLAERKTNSNASQTHGEKSPSKRESHHTKHRQSDCLPGLLTESPNYENGGHTNSQLVHS